MPKHQKQKGSISDLFAASLSAFDQPSNLAPGEVLAAAVIPLVI
ncbi:hypothetical protein ACPOL_4774 [Acidisarcina polymorpha]|uniref:Uncharacterized protein n=1 Tax=Acidisarcina polymorpha TaxID=2211140 RepID=A0A2Z5G4Z5_9BACT|nr:hypothetical protein [Acidisarcina polymorpha]AXC14040.1 hypothetical protein ACPOL_4774 [Acidisarcina polymorpha]